MGLILEDVFTSLATHCSVMAWRIPWTEEPGRLQSLGLQSWTQLNWLSTRCPLRMNHRSCTAHQPIHATVMQYLCECHLRTIQYIVFVMSMNMPSRNKFYLLTVLFVLQCLNYIGKRITWYYLGLFLNPSILDLEKFPMPFWFLVISS